MVYLDSSSLLKLLWNESESRAVARAVAAESQVILSSLVKLEVEAQLLAAHLGGDYGAAQWKQYRRRLGELQEMDPFQFRLLPGAVFQTALDQLQRRPQVHCRTLDRLHLAAVAELGLIRLMTHDRAQAAVAQALGMEVLMPV
jgi:predicted nucleic acid-binding protein